MIPYFELREIPIGGGRSLAAFGTLVALGIFAGAWFAERRARLTVEKRAGLSRTTIWRLEREGKFPKRVQVSKNIVAWRESEVDAWIARAKGRAES